MEEVYLKLSFKTPNGVIEVRLLYPEAFRCSSKVKLFRHHKEVPKMSELQHGSEHGLPDYATAPKCES